MRLSARRAPREHDRLLRVPRLFSASRFERYARAREEQADKLFREIIEIADDASGDYVTTSDGKRIVDHENIRRSRLRVDARKWAAARLAPKKYGDRVLVEICVSKVALSRTAAATIPFTTGSFRACASASRTANNGVHQLSLRARKIM